MRPILSAQLIHQCFGHAYQNVYIKFTKLSIYTDLPKNIFKLEHPCWSFAIFKGPYLSYNPTVYTEHQDLGNLLRMEFISFNRISFQKLSSTLTITNVKTRKPFG